MILFRTDANPQIGFGHLTRCRALAHALRDQGTQCVMVGPDNAFASAEDHELFKAWIPMPWEDSEVGAEHLVEVARSFGATTLVLDDYRVDEAYQLVLRKRGLKWLQFEGRTDRSTWADIVVNANPAAKPEDYETVVRNPEVQFLLGPTYAILRPEFARIKAGKLGRPIKRILVSFGGGDDRGGIELTLSTLLTKSSSNLHFVIMSGAHNPRNSQIAEWVSIHGENRVNLVIDPNNVAQLFSRCDLAIMAGGTSTYEAACCGLPMILITIADNQIPQSKAWDTLNIAQYLGHVTDVSKQNLIEAFIAITLQDALREKMAKNGRRNVDGNGAIRVAQHINEITHT